MNLRKNKRGEGLVLIGIIILLLALNVFFLIPAQDFRDNPIGIKQYEILYQNEQANAAELYLNEASFYSAKVAQKTTFETAGQYRLVSETGGLSETSCRDFFYPLYTAPGDVECLPDFVQTYKQYYLNAMNAYTSAYKVTPLNHLFNIDFNQKETELEIKTLGTEKIYVPLRKSSEELFSSNYDMVNEVVDVSRYPTGLLGSYGNEKTVSCTTGQCLADVARYYLEQYSKDGSTLPYIYGGESPYSYEDTLKDKNENGRDSFFYGVSVTKNQVGKYSNLETEPGFDCSGFVWWVGKHAEVPLLKYRLSADEYYEKAKLSGEKICDELIDGTCDLSLLQQNIRAGDIVFYSQDEIKMSHISIYVGEGNIIHSNPKGLTQNPLLELKNLITSVYRPSLASVGVQRLGQDSLEPIFATEHKVAVFTDSLTSNKWIAYLNTRDLGIIEDIHSTGSLIGNESYLSKLNSDYSDLIVYAGLQEIYSHSELNIIEEKLQTIFSLAKQKGTKVIVLTLPPSKGYSSWTEEISIDTLKLNEWIKNSAKDVDLVIDVYSQLENPDNKETQLKDYVDADSIHPNPQGEELLGELIYEKTFSVNSYAGDGTCDPLVDVAQLNKDAMRYTPDFEAMNKVLVDSGVNDYIKTAHKRFPKVPVPVIKAFLMSEIGSENLLQKYVDKTAVNSKGDLCNSVGYCGIMQMGQSACDSVSSYCDFKELKKGNHEEAVLSGTAFLNLLIEKYFDSDNVDYYFLALAYNAGPGSMNDIKEVAASRLGKPEDLIRWSDILYEDVEKGMKKNSASWAQKKSKWDEIYSYPNIVASVLIQECGVNSIYSNSQKATTNYVSFTPATYTVDSVNLDSMNLINEFISSAQFECKENTPDCIIQQVTEFNEHHKGKITLDEGGEKNELVYDILSQIMSQYKIDQQNCITLIEPNYNLDSEFNKTVISLYSSGEVYVSDSNNFKETNKFLTKLSFNPTTTFNQKIIENNVVVLLVDKNNKEITLGTKEVDEGWLWDSLENVFWSTSKDVRSNVKNVDSLALLKLASSQQIERLKGNNINLGDVIGPASWCTGEEGLPTSYVDRANSVAWNSQGKTYAEAALAASQEKGVDPALLMSHSIWESSMGLNDGCVADGKSSLTGCGWYPECSKDCSCTSSTDRFDSDLGQFKCTASTDKNAYMEATTGMKQSNGAYTKCSPYANDTSKMWNCILCVYQGNYAKDITGKGGLYFTKDGTCSYAEKFKSTYCKWNNYFEDKGFTTSSQVDSENACYGVVEYAKEYLGTPYGGTGSCTAEQAKSGSCSTQCGSFVTNVFKFGYEEGKISPTLWGNGNQKCDQPSTIKNKFSDPLLLQVGDVFTSDGPSAAAQKWGHTGIFVGFGKVSGDAREGTSKANPDNPYCYSNFIPDADGEPVFIHSVGPVCYSTLSQLQTVQRRNIFSFCRPDFCGEIDYSNLHSGDEIETQSINVVIDSPFQWIPYHEKYKNLVCMDGKSYYRFKASFPFTEKELFFSLYIQNEEEIETYNPSLDQELCDSREAYLVSWETASDEDPYYFTIKISPSSDEEESYIRQTLFANSVENLTVKPTTISEKNKLFKYSSAGTDTYYYLFDNNTFEQDIPLGTEQYLFVDSTNEYGVEYIDYTGTVFTLKTKAETILEAVGCSYFKPFSTSNLLQELGVVSSIDFNTVVSGAMITVPAAAEGDGEKSE